VITHFASASSPVPLRRRKHIPVQQLAVKAVQEADTVMLQRVLPKFVPLHARQQ